MSDPFQISSIEIRHPVRAASMIPPTIGANARNPAVAAPFPKSHALERLIGFNFVTVISSSNPQANSGRG